MSMDKYLAALEGKVDFRTVIDEKTLTPAEMKKREEVAQALERENPDMPMDKKMAIATATAKKVAEEAEQVTEAKHVVTVTVSDPNHTAVSKRKEQFQRRASVTASDRESAINTALNHYKRQGYKVHDHQYVGLKEEVELVAEEQLDELKASTLQSYAQKADKDMSKRGKDSKGRTQADRIKQRITGKGNALDRLRGYMASKKSYTAEETEIDESVTWHKTGKEGTHIKTGAKTYEYEKRMNGEPTGEREYRTAEGKSMGEGKEHTVPKTDKEKKLAALAEPKDKITHADVMKGRGVSEEVELDEANDYHKLAVKHLKDAMSKTATPVQKEYAKKMNKRALEASKMSDPVAAKKHYMGVSEEVEVQEGMISYSDFQSKIAAHRKAGNKVVDDKYTDKHATYTTVDSEGTAKKITHTEKGIEQKHLGKVSGAEDDESETKTTEKRGRGRPAGSKSGARR